MPNPIIDELKATVERATTVATSATALINGIGDRISKAIAKALENGASEEELTPFRDLETALENETNALAEAVEANTEPAP